ncbi:MAG TPA: OBAP family protein [Polyangiaceae bacterium]
METKLLEKGAEVLQDLSAVRSFDHYLNGFHVMKDAPALHMEAHHYCKGMNEEFTQCVIFDGNTQDSNLIGIEYIISERLFESLPTDEKKRWHPHNYEILSGQLMLPGVPDMAEKAALAKKLNSYGKTWHVWDTGHWGHPAAQELPVGQPLLAWSYNRDGEAPAALVERRDARMHVDTSRKRGQRADLAAAAKPQAGTEELRENPGAGHGSTQAER